MPAVRFRRLALPVAAALGLSGAVLVASPAAAITFPVATEAELISAITDANAAAGPDTITITAGITLTANLPQITGALTVEGDMNTITAGGYDAFTAAGTSLTVREVVIDSPTQGIEMSNGTLVVDGVQVFDASGGGIDGLESNVLVTNTLVTGSGMPNLTVTNTLPVATSIEVRDSEFSGGDSTGIRILQSGAGTIVADNVGAHGNGDFGFDLGLQDTAVGTITNTLATLNSNYGIMFAAGDDAHLEIDNVDGDSNVSGGRVIVRDTAEFISTGSGPTSNTGVGWYVESYGTGTTTSFSNVLASLNGSGMSLEPHDGATITVTNALIQGGDTGIRISTPFFPPGPDGAVIATDVEIVGSESHGVYIPDSGSVDVTLIQSEIHGVDTTEDGAGIFAELNDATLTLDRSTVHDNATSGSGGGLLVFGDADSALVVTNSTVTGNTAGVVSGLLAVLDGTIDVSHSTFVNAMPGNASAIDLTGETSASLTNSIVDGGALTSDSNQTLTVDYSLVRVVHPSAAPAVDAGTNITGVDPLLNPLADNGGPTPTMLPRAGSPVLNAGDPAFVPPPATDQRGDARVQGGRLDMGAVEVPPALAATGVELGDAWPAGLVLLLGGLALLLIRRRVAH